MLLAPELGPDPGRPVAKLSVHLEKHLLPELASKAQVLLRRRVLAEAERGYAFPAFALGTGQLQCLAGSRIPRRIALCP